VTIGLLHLDCMTRPDDEDILPILFSVLTEVRGLRSEMASWQAERASELSSALETVEREAERILHTLRHSAAY
jgi:hypothetical protein